MGKGRACGSQRDQEALYLTVPESAFGRPWEDFIVDYPIRWTGPRNLRAPMQIKDGNGITHAFGGIGLKFYPFFSDFFEECRAKGLSKRLPLHFDPALLTPGQSKMLLVHPRAIPEFGFEASSECPHEVALRTDSKRLRKLRGPAEGGPEIHEPGDARCAGALWPLSVWSEYHTHQSRVLVQDGVPSGGAEFEVTTPSVTYQSKVPVVDGVELSVQGSDYKVGNMPEELEWASGVVMRFPHFQFEWVSRKRKVPREVKAAIEDAGFVLDVVPE